MVMLVALSSIGGAFSQGVSATHFLTSVVPTPLASTSFFKNFFLASAGPPGVNLSNSQVIIDFFRHLFYHPEKHFIAVIIMGAVAVSPLILLAFVVKRVYDKWPPNGNQGTGGSAPPSS